MARTAPGPSILGFGCGNLAGGGALLLGLLAAGCGGTNTATTTDGGGSTCLSGLIDFNGVCTGQPTIEAARTQCGDVTEYCDTSGSTTPVLTCLTDAPKQHPATPATVTLTGYIHPFSGGSSNATVSVLIYRAADLTASVDITSAAPIVQAQFAFDPMTATDPTQFRACDIDPTVGCVPTDPSLCTVPVCDDGLAGRPDDNKYCRVMGSGNTATGVCEDRLRWERRFSLDGIPTNTPLVIRATGENNMTSTAWNTLVAWNVFLASDDKSCGGDSQATDCLDTTDMMNPKYQLNVNVLSQADYMNIPTTAGLPAGIAAGEGAIAGEVHDCDNIRVGNVRIGVNPAGDRLTYFNGNPFDTLPDSSQAAIGTDRLGLYSSLNIKPGTVHVQAVGLVGGKTVSMGSYDTVVYAGTVSVVNINGGKPVQTGN